MTGQIESYRSEIFNFLRTVTIKFEPFAYLMGQDYMDLYGITDPHQSWNPYYINLTGEYSNDDTRMTVYSVEENRQVPFDKDLITNYPKTAAIYKVPNKEFFTLQERYPDNRGLVRTIAYPVASMKDALAAPNLSLLAYDDSLLEQNERADIVAYLKNFLLLVKNRWWINEYTYEDMYAVTFWAMLWQMLPEVLLRRRFLNIRTDAAHSFHIWEYLKSQGLGDYRDVLNRQQQDWFYRNIDWILQHRGQQDTLNKLAGNILGEIGGSLLDKDMYQETFTRADTPQTNPGFVNRTHPDGADVSHESFDDLNDKLVDSGYENRSDSDYVDDTEKALGNIPYNKLLTKFLEIDKKNLNTANEQLMANFFLDTLIYRLSENQLSYRVTMTDPLTGEAFNTSVEDVLMLLNWSCRICAGEEEPQIKPITYRLHIPFINKRMTTGDLTKSIYYSNCEYPVAQLIDVSAMIRDNTWHAEGFTSQKDFMTFLLDQYDYLLMNNHKSDMSNKLLYHLALNTYFTDVTVGKWVTFNLTTASNYAEWANKSDHFGNILDYYRKENDRLAYENLANQCFETLFDFSDIDLTNHTSSSRAIEKIYSSLRDLFIALGSYNITYLEIDRDYNDYLQYYEPDFTSVKGTNVYEKVWNLTLDDFKFVNKSTVDVNVPDFVHEISTNIDTFSIQEKSSFDIDKEFKLPITWSNSKAVAQFGAIEHKDDVFSFTKKLFTDVLTSSAK